MLGTIECGSMVRCSTCEYRRAMSLPRKILATKVPPGRRTWHTIVSAARMSCACTYSSISCSPVTAPYQRNTHQAVSTLFWSALFTFDACNIRTIRRRLLQIIQPVTSPSSAEKIVLQVRFPRKFLFVEGKTECPTRRKLPVSR